MKRIQVLLFGGLLVAVALVGVTALGADKSEVGFTNIFNGKDFTGIKFTGAAEDTFKVQDGVLTCSGRPNGYWYTEKSYKNYILRFEWRYKRPDGLQNDAAFGGNSGYLVHITGAHKVWPQCIEVQGMNRNVGMIFAIGGAPALKAQDFPDARQAARKPVGEWNEMEIVSLNGTLISRINGEVVAVATGSQVTSGPIGFQSEGAEIHWRNVRIKELAE